MGEPRRIDRLAKLSLLLALGLAALVGGLADWFAVRALFAHPLGLPFPHTAIIPRNRRRITQEIRELVLKEWLPLPVLRSKIEAFDFVGSGLQPLIEPLRPRLREMLRGLGRALLDRLSPEKASRLLAHNVSEAMDADRVRSVLAEVVRQARENNWLEP